jgi:PKD repeat protein
LTGDTINESVSLNIQNGTNVYQSILTIPWTNISITDPFIIPEVESNYNPSQIIWNFGDGTFAYDDTNPVHQYTEPGIYTLTCTVISTEGCVETLTSTITVYVINGCEPLIKREKKYLYTYGIDGKLLKKQ